MGGNESPELTPLVAVGIGTGRTMRVHWALEELGLQYETRPVLSRSGETFSADFLALNPKHKIPVLVHGDYAISESAAILNYLGDVVRPESHLLPKAGTRQRATYDEWAFFISMELDATSLYVVRRHEDLERTYGHAPAAAASSRAYFQDQVGVAESRLADGRPFLLGDAFSGVDILLGSCLDWAAVYGEKLTEHLEAYRSHLSERPAKVRAFATNFPPEVLRDLVAQRQKKG